MICFDCINTPVCRSAVLLRYWIQKRGLLPEQFVEHMRQPVAGVENLPFGDGKCGVEEILPYVGTFELLVGLCQHVDLPAVDGAVVEPVAHRSGGDGLDPVSYTHLTLPTNREV